MTDLHTHSKKSDGEFSPSELMKMAFESGIKTISLTDHDTVSGNAEAEKTCNELGMKFITGIEIGTQELKKLHILGYGIDINNSELLEKCELIRKSRVDRFKNIIKLAEENNIFISESDVMKYCKGDIISQTHIANALLEKGYVSNIHQAFSKYLDTSKFTVPRYQMTYREAIETIHHAGGLAVIAHPYQLKLQNNELEIFIAELVEIGLDGIECYYSKHTPEMMMYYRKIAEKYNLAVSIGSDFHGPVIKPDIHLGSGQDNSLIKLQKTCCFYGSRDILAKL